MNGRKAKLLRRAAERLTAGKPEREYEIGKAPLYGPANTSPEAPMIQLCPGIPTGLHAGCTRVRYQRMKRVWLQAKRV